MAHQVTNFLTIVSLIVQMIAAPIVFAVLVYSERRARERDL